MEVGFAAGAVQELAGEGVTRPAACKSSLRKLEKPRAAWVMLPAGKLTEETVMRLAELMEAGEIVIDSGNSFYKGRHPPRS